MRFACVDDPLIRYITREKHMAISKLDSKKMRRLAQEGKQISKIWKEDFPLLDYWDIYIEVYNSGERSSRCIKYMITTRLNNMAASRIRSERSVMVKELHELVWHLYHNHKTNREKLSKIRSILGE